MYVTLQTRFTCMNFHMDCRHCTVCYCVIMEWSQCLSLWCDVAHTVKNWGARSHASNSTLGCYSGFQGNRYKTTALIEIIQGKVSIINHYSNQLISGPKIKLFPQKTFFCTKVSKTTTAAS